MNKEVLSRALDQIDEKYTEEAVLYPGSDDGAAGRRSLRTLPAGKLRARLAAAAAALLVIGSGFGLRAYAQSNQEYQEAMQFFEENQLSAEGLSRAEVRAVYRDIKTQSFTYEKTALVLEDDIVREIAGLEIEQQAPTPEQLKALWDYRTDASRRLSREWVREAAPGEERIHYELRTSYEDISEQGEIFKDGKFLSSCLEKYDGDTKLWEADFTAFDVRGYETVTGGVLALGESPVDYYSIQDPNLKTAAWLAFVDPEGNILWQRRLDYRHNYEVIGAVAEEEDSFVVLSSGQGETTFTRLSREGKVLSTKSLALGSYTIRKAIRCESGFLAIEGGYGYNLSDKDKLVFLDTEGNLLRSIQYESEDTRYLFNDLILKDGRIYLSATAVPILPNGNSYGRPEIAYTLDKIFGADPVRWDISDEALTPIVRENYRAVLLVCSPDGKTPETFYSVPGSMAGGLTIGEDGSLAWSVQNIATASFSPATNAFTIFGTSYVINYRFPENGAVIRNETDEIVRFFR